MSTRRSKHVVAILLLISAMLISSSYFNIPQPVQAVSITLSPSSGPAGTFVTITGSGFSASDASCSIDGPAHIVTNNNTCTISGGVIVSASFTVNSTAIANYYTITVIGNMKDLASQVFQVTPTIQLFPASGPPGQLVNVTQYRRKPPPAGGNATLFPVVDTTCSVNGDSSIIKSASCVVVGGNVTGTRFTVNNVAAGPYRVWIHGDQSGFNAYATFTVTVTTPSITLRPAVGIPGTKVGIYQWTNQSNVLFPNTDTTCSVNGDNSIIASSSCIIVNGNVTGSSFVANNVGQGPYRVWVHADQSGLNAYATFTVSNPFTPTIVAIPPDGPRGTRIQVQGTGFSSSDVSCQLSSNDTQLIASPSCSISGGVVSASFTVGQSAIVHLPWPTKLNVTGNTGDKAGVGFKVDAQPIILFSMSALTGNPTITTANAGVTIYVRLQNRTQFSSGDSSICTMTSNPGGLFATSACILQGSGTLLNGTVFQIAGSANGAYTVTVTGSLGDSASATFFVNVLTSLVIFPTNATNGATANFRATGFSVSDTGCILQSFNYTHHMAVPNNNLFSSSTCSIIAPQVAQGSFVVGPMATTNMNWTLQVRGTPSNDLIPSGPPNTVFNVTASVTVSPSSGTIGSVFTFAGAGFSSNAKFCGLPSFYPAGLPMPISGSCGIVSPNSGQVAGTFIPKNTAPGVYVISVGDQLGHNASTTFTLGTPQSQITISPNVIIQPVSGQSVFVGISGSGFNGNDTACTVTTYTGIASASTCSISGGLASVSLTVTSTVTPGLYLITLTGKPYGDFGSNYLSVGILTTMISTSTTITSFSSATTTTTLTTYTSISSSLTTTTFTSTGATTFVFTHGTLTTVSGVTTLTSTVTGFTSYPVTGFTTTTWTSTLGQIITRGISDEIGLLGMLLLAIPILLRRLFN